MTEKYLDMHFPHADEGACYVIVTVETFTEDELDRKMELLCDLAEENGSIDEFEADERIWKLRKEFAEAARAIDKMFQTEDFCGSSRQNWRYDQTNSGTAGKIRSLLRNRCPYR